MRGMLLEFKCAAVCLGKWLQLSNHRKKQLRIIVLFFLLGFVLLPKIMLLSTCAFPTKPLVRMMFLHMHNTLCIVRITFCLVCVHSAGAGRTGTFCALSTVLERVKAEGILDVFQTVKSLRLQRPHMVQTLVRHLLKPFFFFIVKCSILSSHNSLPISNRTLFFP